MFLNRLKELRQKNGVKQKDIASMLGVKEEKRTGSRFPMGEWARKYRLALCHNTR